MSMNIKWIWFPNLKEQNIPRQGDMPLKSINQSFNNEDVRFCLVSLFSGTLTFMGNLIPKPSLLKNCSGTI